MPRYTSKNSLLYKASKRHHVMQNLTWIPAIMWKLLPKDIIVFGYFWKKWAHILMLAAVSSNSFNGLGFSTRHGALFRAVAMFSFIALTFLCCQVPDRMALLFVFY